MNTIAFAWMLGPALSFFYRAQVPDRPAVPTNSPISAREIVLALIPEFDVRFAEARAHAEDASDQYSAEVRDFAPTDFGLRGQNYLVAVVDRVSAACASCRDSILGVFDGSSKRLLWRYDSPPAVSTEGGTRAIELSRVEASDPSPTLVYRHFTDNCLECGGNQVKELWLAPRLQAGRLESLKTIWEGLVSWGSNGHRLGTPNEGCGQMLARAEERYEYLARYFVGSPVRYGNHQDSTCEKRAPELPVEFRRTEIWVTRGPAVELQRLSSSPPVRIDHWAPESFPLNLPVRSVLWNRQTESGSNTSPSGRWIVVTSGGSWTQLELHQAGDNGEPIRVVRLGKLEAYDLYVVALGWSSDSRRFFAVTAGLTDWSALLSFSVEGSDDYWEGLLTDGLSDWHDGFVLMPASAPAGSRNADAPHP